MVVRKVKLGGCGRTVEIDESKFGRRKHHRGHRVEGQWVFGGYERETGNCFMIPVENRTAETLLVIIKDWIKPGTTIISDCWRAYNTLNNEGYQHLTVNHSLHFKDPETGVHSNTIESSWRHSKASMSNYCRKKAFYAGYLAKFMFTKHCRSHKLDPTAELFKHAGILYDANNKDNMIFNDGDYSDNDDDSDDDDDGNDDGEKYVGNDDDK
ncbi:unnamed protein product [Macrosiphum euphorbiae]|uniref:ISXO2-like transposase domain-containing protein n=1 Tax=Macrosiphum euphorbiae TaxID=13131 RepID=A0AAV0WJF0_9HEMI|nr:unnamed protein product [Macrosiphum euphorbiae]